MGKASTKTTKGLAAAYPTVAGDPGEGWTFPPVSGREGQLPAMAAAMGQGTPPGYAQAVAQWASQHPQIAHAAGMPPAVIDTFNSMSPRDRAAIASWLMSHPSNQPGFQGTAGLNYNPNPPVTGREGPLPAMANAMTMQDYGRAPDPSTAASPIYPGTTDGHGRVFQGGDPSDPMMWVKQ